MYWKYKKTFPAHKPEKLEAKPNWLKAKLVEHSVSEQEEEP